MSKTPHVALRLNCPRALYEKFSAYRHEARHETRSQALLALLEAGLVAINTESSAGTSKPAAPPASPKAPSSTDRPKKLIPYAGAERNGSQP